jgi:hypothetical protein
MAVKRQRNAREREWNPQKRKLAEETAARQPQQEAGFRIMGELRNRNGPLHQAAGVRVSAEGAESADVPPVRPFYARENG